MSANKKRIFWLKKKLAKSSGEKAERIQKELDLLTGNVVLEPEPTPEPTPEPAPEPEQEPEPEPVVEVVPAPKPAAKPKRTYRRRKTTKAKE
tara:strand:+ start:2326 stop:2601 length:276 start_codon:yes stop_codon:yes gene_type:complete